MEHRKLTRYLISLVMILMMVGLAEWTDEKEILFPEMTALIIGLLIIDKRVWNVKRWQIILLMTLGAAVGICIVRYSPLPYVVNLCAAFAFAGAGADAIMIHSRKKDPSEIFEFIEKFRTQDKNTPIVLVPTSFNTVTEEEFRARGANVIIYANQLTRTGFPAMQNAARTILENHRAKECDDMCMSIKEIINLIPEE